MQILFGFIALTITIALFIEFPVLWFLPIILITCVFFSRDNKEANLKEKQKHRKKKLTTINNPSSLSKTKNPFIETTSIDELIDVKPFIKVRDAINKIGFEGLNHSTLNITLLQIEAEAEMQIFRKEETTIKSLKELANALNSTDLENRSSITLRELFNVDEDDAKDYEEKYMPSCTQAHSSENNLDEEIDENENIGIVGHILSEESLKKSRLEKLRKEVKELEKEYEFERRYDPSWDTDECLFSKYKDEEQYLKARKEELQRKNLAYNNYLDPREREYLRDETEGFYYE